MRMKKAIFGILSVLLVWSLTVCDDNPPSDPPPPGKKAFIGGKIGNNIKFNAVKVANAQRSARNADVEWTSRLDPLEGKIQDGSTVFEVSGFSDPDTGNFFLSGGNNERKVEINGHIENGVMQFGEIDFKFRVPSGVSSLAGIQGLPHLPELQGPSAPASIADIPGIPDVTGEKWGAILAPFTRDDAASISGAASPIAGSIPDKFHGKWEWKPPVIGSAPAGPSTAYVITPLSISKVADWKGSIFFEQVQDRIDNELDMAWGSLGPETSQANVAKAYGYASAAAFEAAFKANVTKTEKMSMSGGEFNFLEGKTVGDAYEFIGYNRLYDFTSSDLVMNAVQSLIAIQETDGGEYTIPWNGIKIKRKYKGMPTENNWIINDVELPYTQVASVGALGAFLMRDPRLPPREVGIAYTKGHFEFKTVGAVDEERTVLVYTDQIAYDFVEGDCTDKDPTKWTFPSIIYQTLDQARNLDLTGAGKTQLERF
jgi:hypothetical protein